jgi:hypothetical protein
MSFHAIVEKSRREHLRRLEEEERLVGLRSTRLPSSRLHETCAPAPVLLGVSSTESDLIVTAVVRAHIAQHLRSAGFVLLCRDRHAIVAIALVQRVTPGNREEARAFRARRRSRWRPGLQAGSVVRVGGREFALCGQGGGGRARLGS